MTKRIIKIILILLAVFLLILGGVWLIGRHEAQKNGTTPLTFREFLGLSAGKNGESTAPGTLTSAFTSDNGSTPDDGTNDNAGSAPANDNSHVGNGGATGDQGQAGTDNTNVSQFNGDTISPSDNTSFDGTGNVGTGSGLGTDNTVNDGSDVDNTGTGDDTGLGGNTGTTGPTGLGAISCSPADTTITFTPDEITKLNALQAQYNAIAASLATSDQVATEKTNYNTYKLEEEKIAELQNFCETNTPLLTNPAMQRHVPTPFWHDANQDSETFTGGGINPNADGTNPTSGESFLERILRINLW